MAARPDDFRRPVDVDEVGDGGNDAILAEIAELRSEIAELSAHVSAIEEDAEKDPDDGFRMISGTGMDVQSVDGTLVVAAIPQYRYIRMNWLEGCFTPDEEEGE